MVLKNLFNSHNDDKHYGSAKRDTANGVAGLDASKEIINDVPIAKIVDMDKQSFTNLLENGDFESWSAGAAAAPDGWILSGGSVARSATHKKGDYGAQVTSGGTLAQIYHQILNYGDFPNTNIIATCWVKTSTPNIARLKLGSGGGAATTYSDYHTGGGDWELLTVKHASLTPGNLILYCTAENTGDVIYDGTTMVEGLICPAFSPKPLIDDGKTLEVESDTNTVKVGGKLVMTCTPQILTGAGAISVESCITHLVTGGVGADAITLADGVEGQEKIVLIKTLTAGGDTSVVTPAHFAHGTTFTGNQAGSIQNLIFTNGSWHWTGGRNTVIA